MCVFGDFKVHHKDWLAYSSGTDRPDELCYNFSFSSDLPNFSTRILDCDSHSPALLDLFIYLLLVFILQWLSLQWVSQFPVAFHHIQNRMSRFIA